MNDPQSILLDIRERLVRIEERADARDARMARLENTVAQLERFRWWILGGIGAAGSMGGLLAKGLERMP